MSSSKTTKSTETSSNKTKEELLSDVAHFEFQTVEIMKGKNFPIHEKYECVKVGISHYGKPYVLITVDDTDRFCDPKNLKALKPLSPARIAAIKARLEADREATLIVSGTIKSESEKAVLLSHHGWYKAKWFPKSLISVLGDHEDGEQKLYEVPLWKIKVDGPDVVAALEALQDGFVKMLRPKSIVGKTTLIKKGSK